MKSIFFSNKVYICELRYRIQKRNQSHKSYAEKKKTKMEEKSQKTQTYYSNQWKKHQKSILLAFNKDADTEILEYLESVPNKTDYVRQLRLADIAEEKKRTKPKD